MKRNNDMAEVGFNYLALAILIKQPGVNGKESKCISRACCALRSHSLSTPTMQIGHVNHQGGIDLLNRDDILGDAGL